jgi:copper chaperone CopZ
MDMPHFIARRILLVSTPAAALLLLALAPGISEAQEGRAGVGARGSVGVLNNDPATTAPKQTVSLRIHPKSLEEATSVTNSLLRQQGVTDVKLSDDLRTVSCTYQGAYGDLPKLEARSSGSLLSPAKIVVALVRDPARAKCQTCGVDEHLRSTGGVVSVVAKGSRAELYANLDQLDVRKLAEAVEAAGYQLDVQSHAWWSVKIEGDAARIPEAFTDLKGILKVDRAGSDVKLLTLRALSPEAIVSAAQKAGLKATPTLLR